MHFALVVGEVLHALVRREHVSICLRRVSWVIQTLVVIESEIPYNFPRFFGVDVTKLASDAVVNFVLKRKRDMIIENLDLEPNIDAMMRDFDDIKYLKLFRIMAGVDINTLTMEQYLALSRENQAPGVVKLEIGGNVNFEIKSQFMRELREDTFSRNKNEDAHDHVDRVLNIELPTLETSLKKPLSKGIVHNPRPLNDLKTSTTSSKKAMNRYTKLGNGLNTMNRQLLDSHGPIPRMTPTQALTAIQTMVDHSQKWQDRTSSRNISSNSNTDGLAAIISKLDNLGCDMKILKENVHAIQVGCANVNVMPRNVFEHLRLANLRNTNMLVEMADMTKKTPLGIIENILESITLGKKGHMLDKIWEYYKDVHRDNTYWWHDHGFKKEECDEMGIEIEKYDPPKVSRFHQLGGNFRD
ncbi:hypothetical protein Tco_0277916 [Tanacetum coccineum]